MFVRGARRVLILILSALSAASAFDYLLSSPREDPRRAFEADAGADVADEVEDGRGDQEEGVAAVQDAAVPGDHGAHVLDADVALDGGDEKVAELAAYRDDRAQGQEGEGRVRTRAAEDEMADERGEGRGEDDGAERTADGLAGAGVRGELAAAERLAGAEREDVVEL